ncbi:MAG: Holliday junction resolvase RuvX [Phycisphaerae bacterium]
MDTSDKPPTPVRVLGIDFGLRRIGLALGDTVSRLATPFDCLEGLTDFDAAAAITKLAHDEQISTFICGMPLNEDGSPNPQSRRTSEFITSLRAASGMNVLPVNEFLTTFEAENLLAGNFTSGQKKKRVDALAAARILQAYLNSLA